MRAQSNIYSILFVVLAIVAGFGTFLQTYMITVAGVRLTSRLRLLVFKSIINQEMGWFDESRNSVGALCTRLSGDCSSVQGVNLLNLYEIETVLTNEFPFLGNRI